MQLKTYLPKNIMADPCLTFTHVAEHPVAKYPYTIGQFSHNYSICTSCNVSSNLKMNIVYQSSRKSRVACNQNASVCTASVTSHILPKNDSMAIVDCIASCNSLL